MAAGVGVLSVAGIAVATALDAVDLALACVLSGLWGFVVPTYLAVAHRMIPFFTSSAVPMVACLAPVLGAVGDAGRGGAGVGVGLAALR